MKKVQHHHVHLNNREITNFLHNAQLATCEVVSGEVIPALHEYTSMLLHVLKESKFTKVELACVMSSAAYALWSTRDEDTSVGCGNESNSGRSVGAVGTKSKSPSHS